MEALAGPGSDGLGKYGLCQCADSVPMFVHKDLRFSRQPNVLVDPFPPTLRVHLVKECDLFFSVVGSYRRWCGGNNLRFAP